MNYEEKIKKIIEDNNFKEYCKLCFELYEKVEFDAIKLKNIAVLKNVKFKELYENAKLYALEIIKLSEKTWNEKDGLLKLTPIIQEILLTTDIKIHPENVLFYQLRKTEDDKKIIEIMENYEYYKGYLKGSVFNFVITYYKEEKEFLTDSIRKKIEIYEDYYKQQQKEKRAREKERRIEKQQQEEKNLYTNSDMKNILESFIEGRYGNKKTFCDQHKIDYEYFDKIIECAQKYDQETYQRYLESINNERNQRFVIILSFIKRLIDNIQNGIKLEDGTTRPFDIVDYFLLTKINFDNLLNIIDKSKILTKEEYVIIRRFIAQNKRNVVNRPNEITRILSPKSVQVIGDRTITQEEKQLIINYLKTNNIPQNQVTYSLTLKKYLNNSLLPEKQNIMKLKKVKPQTEE